MKKIFVLCVFVAISVSCADLLAQWTWTPQTGRFINLKRMPKETAELQLEYARSLYLQGDLKKALKETEKFIDFYGQDPLADQNLFLRGEIKMAMGKWLEAAKEFQKLISTYPGSTLYGEAVKKQFEIGDKLYEKGTQQKRKFFSIFKGKPLKQAIEVYGMVVSNQPFMPGSAEAQYKIGLCHHARKEYLEASFEYKRVIENYPQSEWVDDARYSLAKCYCDGSLHPIYDQSRSELAVEAIDDFIRAYPTDSRVEELKELRQTMRNKIAEQKYYIATFYERRREFQSARIYYQVVATQYADTPIAERAKRWLDENPVQVSEIKAQFEQGIQR